MNTRRGSHPAHDQVGPAHAWSPVSTGLREGFRVARNTPVAKVVGEIFVPRQANPQRRARAMEICGDGEAGPGADEVDRDERARAGDGCGLRKHADWLWMWAGLTGDRQPELVGDMRTRRQDDTPRNDVPSHFPGNLTPYCHNPALLGRRPVPVPGHNALVRGMRGSTGQEQRLGDASQGLSATARRPASFRGSRPGAAWPARTTSCAPRRAARPALGELELPRHGSGAGLGPGAKESQIPTSAMASNDCYGLNGCEYMITLMPTSPNAGPVPAHVVQALRPLPVERPGGEADVRVERAFSAAERDQVRAGQPSGVDPLPIGGVRAPCPDTGWDTRRTCR
eukprot:gene1308-biopygen9473